MRARWMVGIVVLLAFLAVPLAAVSMSGCTSEQKILDTNRERVTQLLVQETQLREFLENQLYGLDGNVIIATYHVEAHPEAVIYRDGRLIFPEGYNLKWYRDVKSYEKTIVELFQTFKCENIALYQPGGTAGQKKAINIVFDNIRINDKLYHAQFLSYSRDATPPGTGSDAMIFKDWYYSTPSYT